MLNLFSNIDSSFPTLIHLFRVANNFEAVLFILPLVIYTLHAYLTSFETTIVGLLFRVRFLFILLIGSFCEQYED